MNLRPCPNPACRSEDVKISDYLPPHPADDYVVCPNCAMCGPDGDPHGFLWNAMCDALAPASPGALTIDERADMVVRLCAHWDKRKRNEHPVLRREVDLEYWTGCDDDVLRRAVREMETWEAVQRRQG